MVEMVPIESTNIAAIGYDPASMDLHVKFKNGPTYIHKKVAPSQYATFLGAKSKGGHYHKTFRANPDHPHEILKPQT